MPALERVARAGMVQAVGPGAVPLLLRVAAVAGLPEAAGVDVLVAGDASLKGHRTVGDDRFDRQVGLRLRRRRPQRGMAAVAGQVGMFTRQREPGSIVPKPSGRLPAVELVAG